MTKSWIGAWDEIVDLKFLSTDSEQWVLVASGSMNELRLMRLDDKLSVDGTSV